MSEEEGGRGDAYDGGHGRGGGPGGDLRQLFLEAARKILREPDTSLDLRKVAEAAGKSRTAPYLVFGKTDEGGGLSGLQLAVAAEGFRELTSRMEEAHRTSRDSEEGLRAMATAYLTFARDEPRLFRLMFGAEVGRALSHPAPDGPGRREQTRLLEARGETERALLRAIGVEDRGYLRRHGALGVEDLSGAVWAMLHGVAMLTIDRQWQATRLGGLDDPEKLASRALRFLTTASSETMEPAREALIEAMLEKRGRGEPSLANLGDMDIPRHVQEDRLDYDADRLDYVADRLDHVADRSSPSRPVFASRSSPPSSRRQDSPALRRARDHVHLAEGARILWLDDAPARSAKEAEIFTSLGAGVTRARTTEEAVKRLKGEDFDLIISDIARGDTPDAGVRALPRLRRLAPSTPVIFYVGTLRPDLGPPPGAFGITNDPEELVHLVFDALERVRV